MKKIVTVVGARPQFIKAAVVSREIRKTRMKEIIIHTGQHFDANMSDIFFEEMDIPKPDYHLEIHSLSHGAMTGRMLEEIEKVLFKEKPDAVMVYGDTNSTLAGVLAAKKLHIPAIHVEAGLRSFNMKMPEEINRILTDRISDYLFCPTETAVKNLHKEGFGQFPCKIIKSGDVMYDAALYYSNISAKKSKIIQSLQFQGKEFILGTIHRQENTDNPENLRAIIEGLDTIHTTTPVIIPLHPRTQKILQKEKVTPNFVIIDPIGYFDMIELLKHCQLVITDSGGLQKEAFFFQKFCITLREDTEWVELVRHHFNALAGANKKNILTAFESWKNKELNFDIPFYGEGNASKIITKFLVDNIVTT